MSDVAAFIAARLNEKEAAAQELLRGAQDAQLQLQEPRLLGKQIPEWYRWPDVEAMAARALREVAAMRAILAGHSTVTEWNWPSQPDGSVQMEYVAALRRTLRHLAAIWESDPDYDPEWKP